jgi:hypothetical protein
MSVKCPRPPRGNDPDDLADFLEQVERQLTLVGSRTLDVGSILAGAVGTFTIPVIGCKVNQDQTVAISAPSALATNLLWCGCVTANDEVTVRVYNPTGSSIDPASGTWGARVFL